MRSWQSGSILDVYAVSRCGAVRSVPPPQKFISAQFNHTLVGGTNNDFAMIPRVAPSAGVQPTWRGQGDVIVLKLR